MYLGSQINSHLAKEYVLIFQLWHKRETRDGGCLSTTDVTIEQLDVLPHDVLPIILCRKFNNWRAHKIMHQVEKNCTKY